MNGSLASGFIESARVHPDRPAVQVAGSTLTYAELRDLACSWAVTLDDVGTEGPKLTAVLGARSVEAVTGVLAALLRGHGYVPLNPTFPADRLVDMLERSGCTALIVDPQALGVLEEVLAQVPRALTLLVPNGELADLPARFPQHTWITQPINSPWSPPQVSMDDIAYLLFTSGSTGRPKGVMVAHKNIRHFVDVMVERYGLVAEDRFSQTFELVFDLSLFDHFCAWQVGALLVIPSKADLLTPARYLALNKLTVWFSVPSLGQLMRKLGMLRADFYPDLRWVLFCGEALPATVAKAFAEAAPNAVVENLYGPTEVTLACTLYRWDRVTSAEECLNGMVPIGQAYTGLIARIVDEDLHEVADGESGELLLVGPQVCPGYWQDPEKTAVAFTTIPGHEGVHYRTGDRVVRAGKGAPIKFLGRVDHQIKLHGFRIELGEIESVIEELCGEQAVVIPWPVDETGPQGLVGFVLGPVPEGFSTALETKLPAYMVPSEFHQIPSFPLNTNGKIDRKALAARLQND